MKYIREKHPSVPECSLYLAHLTSPHHSHSTNNTALLTLQNRQSEVWVLGCSSFKLPVLNKKNIRFTSSWFSIRFAMRFYWTSPHKMSIIATDCIVIFISFVIFKSFSLPQRSVLSFWIRLVSDFLETRTLSIEFLDPKECYEVSRC